MVTKGMDGRKVSSSLKGKDYTAVESVFTPVKLMKVFEDCGLSSCFGKNDIEEEIEEHKNTHQTCTINGNVVSSQAFHNCFTAFMNNSKTDANTKKCIEQRAADAKITHWEFKLKTKCYPLGAHSNRGIVKKGIN